MRTNPTLIVQYMQVDKVRIVGRSLSAYTPSWSSHLETVVSSMATKNQILCRFVMPDTSKLPENYIYEVDALSCPRGEVLLASAEL